MKRAKRKYKTAQLYTFNITELGKMFDMSRDTVRRRLTAMQVAPRDIKKGHSVYILAEAAVAIINFEDEFKRDRAYW